MTFRGCIFVFKVNGLDSPKTKKDLLSFVS